MIVELLTLTGFGLLLGYGGYIKYKDYKEKQEKIRLRREKFSAESKARADAAWERLKQKHENMSARGIPLTLRDKNIRTTSYSSTRMQPKNDDSTDFITGAIMGAAINSILSSSSSSSSSSDSSSSYSGGGGDSGGGGSSGDY